MEGGFVESFPFFAWPVGFLIVFVIALRFYFKGAKFSERVKGKNMVAVVSGCNCGIGKQVARELNLRGLKVYMLCRDEDRARMAIVELIKLGCDPDRLIFKQLDLAKFSTVHKAAEEIAQDEEKVDLLINNAGVFMYPKFKLTDDGHELVWQTNYLGHFLLTELLLPLLSKAPLARIVNVSAATHYHSDPLDLQFVDRRDGWDSRQSYAKSKLALVMHVCGLTVRLRGDHVPNITINSCHPGASYTRLFRHTPLAWKLISSICAPIMWYFLKTPKDAAQVVLHLALSKKVQGVSGGYFSGFNIKEPLSMEDWDKCCKELYEYSLETCGLHR